MDAENVDESTIDINEDSTETMNEKNADENQDSTEKVSEESANEENSSSSEGAIGFKKTLTLANKNFSIETGFLAKQADASALITHGETTVLCTLSVAKEKSENVDFLPLTVNYIAKNYAFRRIRSGYIKREGKLSDQEIIVTRIIDRSIRPLVKKGFHYEIHVTCTLLSHDGETNPDIACATGASLLLMMAGIPLENGPSSMVRLGLDANQQIIINPNNSNAKNSPTELLLAATNDSVVMIESCAYEVSEEQIAEMIELGLAETKKVNDFLCDFVKELHEKFDDDSETFELAAELEVDNEILTIVEQKLSDIFAHKSKKKVNFLMNQLYKQICKDFSAKYDSDALIKKHIELAVKKTVRKSMFEKNIRIDGRGHDVIRSIDCNVDILPKVHGSAVFTRGNTQVMSTITIGGEGDGQNVESINSLEEISKEKFMIHYNFPPYATGDSYPFRTAPGRREIGHGNLAQKSFYAVLPTQDSFAYTTRVVAEVLESDGSSSMATVCSTSLALKHAGVPIIKLVAGIAMGCFSNENNHHVISDISGIEDQCGMMDFKIAGTTDGITAIQMDTKSFNININLINSILAQAKVGRMDILQKINAATENLGEKINENIPLQGFMNIDRNHIKYVIGSGGKNIKEICTSTNSRISIAQEGKITISAENQEIIDEVKGIISQIVSRPVVGKKYMCQIVSSYRTGLRGFWVEFPYKRRGLLLCDDDEKYSENSEVEAILVDVNSEGKCYFRIEGDESEGNTHNNNNFDRRKPSNNPNSYNYVNKERDNDRRNRPNNSFGEDRRKKTPRFF